MFISKSEANRLGITRKSKPKKCYAVDQIEKRKIETQIKRWEKLRDGRTTNK